MINNKYEMVLNDVIEIKRLKLKRIRATQDFGDVKAGDLGGYIEHLGNLNFTGNCWVYDNARVHGKASIRGDAKIKQNADVYDRAIVGGKAIIMGDAKIYADAVIDNNVLIDKNVRVLGGAKVLGDARLTDNVNVSGSAQVSGTTYISGDSLIYGRARISNIANIDNMCIGEGLILYSIKDNNFDNFMNITAFRKHITAIKLSNDNIMLNIDRYSIDIKHLKTEIHEGLLPDKLKGYEKDLLNSLQYIEYVMGR